MPVFDYLFAAFALDAFAANRVRWQDVLWVLDVAHPTVRQHIGPGVLRVIGADERGEALMVTLIETGDAADTYEIVTARYLDAAESSTYATLLEEK